MPEFHEKECSQCGLWLALEFYHRRSRSRDGRQARCKYCQAAADATEYERTRVRDIARATAWKTANPDARRTHRRNERLKRYGLTRRDFDRMSCAQCGRCAICGTDKPGGTSSVLKVDHIKGTLIVRGLLCNSCNAGLGQFGDNPTILRAAADYLDVRGFKSEKEVITNVSQ